MKAAIWSSVRRMSWALRNSATCDPASVHQEGRNLLRADGGAGSAKSVFHFDVQSSVAKSTQAAIPWLRFIRKRLGARVHFWPFDGWDVPAGQSAIAEVYPRMWSRSFDSEGRTADQHDAYSVARWLSRADHDGTLAGFLNPVLTPPERTVAEVEGWILSVAGRSPV